MKITVQSFGLTPRADLQERLEKKINKLETFYDRIHGCKVSLKIENTPSKSNKTAELHLTIPGDEVVVKKTSFTFEESIESAIDTAKKLLIKKKQLEQS